MDAKAVILEHINANDEELSFIAKEIWDHPQVALTEDFAAGLLADKLAAAGFRVDWGAGGMETAFVAEWGEGAPLIGFLGEYDALPGLSQALSSQRSPLEEGGPGHGCGHNLFGTACLGAVLALQAALQRRAASAARFASTAARRRRRWSARPSWRAMASLMTWTPPSAGTRAIAISPGTARHWR